MKGAHIDLQLRLLEGFTHRRNPRGFELIGRSGNFLGLHASTRKYPGASGKAKRRITAQQKCVQAVGLVTQKQDRGSWANLAHKCSIEWRRHTDCMVARECRNIVQRQTGK